MTAHKSGLLLIIALQGTLSCRVQRQTHMRPARSGSRRQRLRIVTLRGGGDEDVTVHTEDDDAILAKIQVPPSKGGVTSQPRHHDDTVVTGSSIKSLAKDALERMKASSPIESLKNVKNQMSIDALRAKASAISLESFLQILFLFGSRSRPLTPLSVLSLSLLGSSLGFVSYLWFATVGYCVAVGLVALAALVVYNLLPILPVPMLSNLQTILVLVWSIRLTAFLLYREYVAWYDLHIRTKEVDLETQESKLGIWVTCACFYAAMIAPCCYRLQAGLDLEKGKGSWGIIGKFGLFLQVTGLIFESVADAQKATFKASEGNRSNWCNVGLWKYFSHPNYLGEVTFWVGVNVGGIGSYSALYQYLISAIGLMFIAWLMKSATDSLSSQELRRYGMNEEYLEFRRKRGFLGPRPFIQKRQPENQILL